MAHSSTSFAHGNHAAVRHGLKSGSIAASRRAQARAEISALLTANLGHLKPSDTPLIDLACDVISDLQQIRQYLDARGGIINRKGQPQGCAALYATLMRQAIAIFDRLGVGPVARGQVMSGLGFEALSQRDPCRDKSDGARSSASASDSWLVPFAHAHPSKPRRPGAHWRPSDGR